MTTAKLRILQCFALPASPGQFLKDLKQNVRGKMAKTKKTNSDRLTRSAKLGAFCKLAITF